MWLQVLGSAAGGGFPQWNCGCPGCRAVRTGSRPARPRTQSSIAVSADQRNWFLLNASPDVRAQIEAFPPLHPPRGPRHARCGRCCSPTPSSTTRSACCCCGRRSALEVHATPAVHETLRDGTGVLAHAGALLPGGVAPGHPGRADVPLGEGLSYRAFDVPTTKRARFGTGDRGGPGGGLPVHRRAQRTGRGVPAGRAGGSRRRCARELADCAALLIDGTCWHDDELIRLGLAAKTVGRDGPPADRRPGRQPGAAGPPAASSAGSTSTSTTPTPSCWRTPRSGGRSTSAAGKWPWMVSR